MDAVVKVQLTERADQLGPGVRPHPAARPSPTTRSFSDLEFAFDAGGMIRSAMNEGKSTPINIRVTGKNQKVAHKIADGDQGRGQQDRRRRRRPDHPAARLSRVHHRRRPGQGGRPRALTQADVMKNVVAAFNSSIQFNKQNFWIDPVSKNQYFVGVQYLRGGHQVDRDAAGHPDHQPEPEAKRRSRCATSPRSRRATRADRGHPQQPPADDRPDDGRLRPRPGPRLRRRRPGRSTSSASRQRRRHLGALRPATSRARSALHGLEDRAQRRVLADAGHVPQPGLRPDPGVAADLLPDGRPGQVVRRAADGHARSCRSA